MKKLCSFLLLLILADGLFAQDIFITRNGKVDFRAGTSIEDVDGMNTEVASLLNIKTGEIAINIPVKSFRFKRALMEEHFNENYMESTKFPKASYKGKITNLAAVNFAADGQYTVSTEGELTIHGVTKKITAPGKIIVQNGKITGESNFKILLSDYQIQVPSVVADKISKEAEITIQCLYEPKS